MCLLLYVVFASLCTVFNYSTPPIEQTWNSTQAYLAEDLSQIVRIRGIHKTKGVEAKILKDYNTKCIVS